MARIGINTRFLIHGKMEGFGWYTYEICKRITENHPEHEFFFFFDRPYHPEFKFAQNVTPIILRPAARHPLLFILWFELLIPRALKKHKIDLFFSPDGYVSLRTSIPQICTIHDINFEHYPKDIPPTPRRYLRYFFPKFARKAKHIITVSNHSREDIVHTYSIPPNKITAVWNGASESFKPLTTDKISIVRNGITDGTPYFVFVGSIHPRKNLNRLLAAYEDYAKESRDPWHLVIVGENMWKKSGLSYTPSSECSKLIHFTGRLNQEELAETVGSAGGLVFIPYFEGFGIPLVEAMKCGIPILSGNRSCLPEIAGDAAIYCDPFDVASIKKGLEEISGNLALQKQLGSIGLDRQKIFSWDKAADEVWKIIEMNLPK